jgi:hypothetical protein
MGEGDPLPASANTPTFDRVIDDLRHLMASAASRQDWHAALEATFSSLLWRSLRLAVRLRIVPKSFEPSPTWKANTLQLRVVCAQALAREDDYRVEVIADVVDGLMAVAAALESGGFKSADGAIQLTISAANLGRCEIMLGFAEEGFWEQIYQWRSRKVGRPPETYAKWKDEIAAPLTDWMSKNPTSSVDDRIDWLVAELPKKGIHLSRDAIRSGYYQMKRSKVIRARTP